MRVTIETDGLSASTPWTPGMTLAGVLAAWANAQDDIDDYVVTDVVVDHDCERYTAILRLDGEAVAHYHGVIVRR